MRFAHTLDEFIAEVRRVAAADPTRVYRTDEGSCRYFRDGQPDCIIGRALYALGYGEHFVRRPEFDDEFGPVDAYLFRAVGVERTDPKAQWLGTVQAYQDGRRRVGGTDGAYASWAEAVQLADDEAVAKGRATRPPSDITWL